jgi:hypothetical protein
VKCKEIPSSYIDHETSSRLENQIKEIQANMEKKKTEIIQIQSSAQATAGKGNSAQ